MIPGLCSLNHAGALSTGGLQAIATPTAIFTTGTGGVTSSAFTAHHLGGTATYSYAWNYVAGPVGITINSPTASSSTASATLGPGDLIRGFVAVTITDGAGTITESNQVTLQFQYG